METMNSGGKGLSRKNWIAVVLVAAVVLIAVAPMANAQMTESERADQAGIESSKIAGKKKLRELGLHNGQSQERVKSILMSHGFGPWECNTVGYTVQCLAIQSLPPHDKIAMIFDNVMRRDPDSGIAY